MSENGKKQLADAAEGSTTLAKSKLENKPTAVSIVENAHNEQDEAQDEIEERGYLSTRDSKRAGLGLGIGIFLLLIISLLFLFVGWGGIVSLGTTAIATILGIMLLCGPCCCCGRVKRYSYPMAARRIASGLVCTCSICILLYLIFILRVSIPDEPQVFVGSIEWLIIVILTPIALVLSLVFVLLCAKT